MRPEFGCRVHDHVFAPVNASTAGAIAQDVRSALEQWEPRIDLRDVLVTFDRADAGSLYIDVRLLHQGFQRPAQPGLPVLRDPGREPDWRPQSPRAVGRSSPSVAALFGTRPTATNRRR